MYTYWYISRRTACRGGIKTHIFPAARDAGLILQGLEKMANLFRVFFAWSWLDVPSQEEVGGWFVARLLACSRQFG
jgi:hypothetical protein